MPTTINNVETLAAVVPILERGAHWFAQMGTEQSKGMKLYQISGPVRRPGVYELPMGTTFRELIYEWAGGPLEPIQASSRAVPPPRPCPSPRRSWTPP